MAGPYDRWPLGKGFDRYYGFLGAETDQFSPDLVYDNHYIEPPKTAEEGYHLTEDLTDKAIAFLRDLRSADPTKPFFMYFCPGATHAPHQAPREWIEKYQGKFDAGWDAYREADTPAPAGDGHPAARHRAVAAARLGQGLGHAQRRRTAAVRAHDGGVRRLPDPHRSPHRPPGCRRWRSWAIWTTRSSSLVSDNGASGEGGYFGSFNENLIFNGVPDTLEAELQAHRRAGGTETPTATIRPAGRWRATHRSSAGSATSSTAASPTR